MTITSLHLLLTYECPSECDHCFVWSGPNARRGTLSIADLRTIFREAGKLGTVNSIFFEGGEPFLYYPILVKGIQMAKREGFEVGVLTNGYWATTLEDALEWLKPLKESEVRDLTVSNDAFHYSPEDENRAEKALRAAEAIGLNRSTIALEKPNPKKRQKGRKGKPVAGGGLMFRGRAAANLAWQMPRRPWGALARCPHEDLENPQRVHIDPFGYVQVCQGISIGNFRETPLSEILRKYRPRDDPVIGTLIKGGPAALVRAYGVPHEPGYVDECHLCYEVRLALRERFHGILAPDQAYGLFA